MKNYMEEVANILGVELGEEFEVCLHNNPVYYTYAMLTDNGIKITNTNSIVINSSDILEWILCGITSIKPIKNEPWRPKFDEKYYSIGVDGTVEDGTWLNDFLDYSLYKLGNCYRTPEEARANRSKWGMFYDSDEVLEI